MGRSTVGKPPILADTAVADLRDRPFATMRWRGELPHLDVTGGTYFVTFCLAGIERRRSSRAAAADLDVEVVCSLCEPTNGSEGAVELVGDSGSLVEDALLHFHGERCNLLAWCVMPDHVHVIFQPLGDESLAHILHSWKSFTAKAINHGLGRQGPVWEREYFDHVVRSGPALARFVEYTEMNPVTAGLCRSPQECPLSSARHRR